ncbi:MAG: family transcriptional regulator, cyclic receptor protein [bacterium]|jgi:CRP-like cAMP-binding protein
MDPERLKAIPVFASLDEQTLLRIAIFASEVSHPAGRELVRQGDYAREFMAIEEGEVEILRDGERIATLGPGDFFGEIGVLEKTRRTATVVATTPVRLVLLTHWDLKRAGDALTAIREVAKQRRGNTRGASQQGP